MSEVVGAGILPRLRQKGAVKSKGDRGSRLIIFLGVIVSVTVAFYFGSNGIALLPKSFFYPGIGIMVLGIIVRQWSIAVLGRFFSLSVVVTSEHKIVDAGPYRFIRHPSYTGALLTLIGLGLALQSWGAVVLLSVIFGAVFGYRIQVEEGVLKKELGEEYVNYAKRTKRLIPFLL